jgi:hypothetical protein
MPIWRQPSAFLIPKLHLENEKGTFTIGAVPTGIETDTGYPAGSVKATIWENTKTEERTTNLRAVKSAKAGGLLHVARQRHRHGTAPNLLHVQKQPGCFRGPLHLLVRRLGGLVLVGLGSCFCFHFGRRLSICNAKVNYRTTAFEL